MGILSARAFCDDALVLPAGLWRLYAVPAWTTVESTFDANGERREIPAGSGRIRSFNLGLAAEVGITDWITAGIQWTPGAILSSSLDYPAGDPSGRDRANLDDSFDALAGVKLGIVGSRIRGAHVATGLVRSDWLRLAFGLAVRFPVGTIDWDREASRFSGGDRWLAQAADRHLVAPVLGLHVDLVLLQTRRQELFVNLYVQYTPYLSTAKYAETSLSRFLDPSLSEVRIDYRYDAYLEAEPRFDAWVTPGKIRLGAALPIRYRVLPAARLDGVDQGNSGFRATVLPMLDLMAPLPGFVLEVRLGWQRTFSGRNALAPDGPVLVLRAML